MIGLHCHLNIKFCVHAVSPRRSLRIGKKFAYKKYLYTCGGRKGKKVSGKKAIEEGVRRNVSRKRKEIHSSNDSDEECKVVSNKYSSKVGKIFYMWPSDNLPIREVKLEDLVGNMIPLLDRKRATTHVEEPLLLADYMSGKSVYK